MSMFAGITRTPEDLIAHGYQVKLVTYVQEGWKAFAENPFSYVGFVWSCMLGVFSVQLLLGFLGQVTHNAFLTVLLSVTFLLMLPGILLFTIIGPATASWSHLQGIPPLFWRAFIDRKLISQVIMCGLVSSLLLGLYASGLSWLVILFATPLSGLDSHQVEAPAFITGGLVAFLYPGVNWTFVPFLNVDRRLGVWDAIQASWKVIERSWWAILGLDLILLFPMALLWTLVWLLPFEISVKGGLVFLILGPSLALAGSVLGLTYFDIFGVQPNEGH